MWGFYRWREDGGGDVSDDIGGGYGMWEAVVGLREGAVAPERLLGEREEPLKERRGRVR